MHHPLQKGMSLAEMLLALALVALLAASFTRLPLGAARSAALFDAVRLALHQARSSAVASRCPVRVQITTGSLSLLQQSSCGSAGYSAGDSFNTGLIRPGDLDPYSIAAPAEFPLPVQSFTFNALGQALDGSGSASNLALVIAGRSLLVVGETGLAHAP